MNLRAAFVAEGNANTPDCWSGCAQGFVSALRGAGVTVDAIDTSLTGFTRLNVAARSYSPDLRRWRRRFAFSSSAFRARSRRAGTALLRARQPYDVVIQAGATFLIERESLRGAPSVIYADANIRFARRGRPFSGVTHLRDREVERVAAHEQQVYDQATRIWTWSEILVDSFRRDFHQPANKLLAVLAGANTDASDPPPRRPLEGSPPTVLFVGRDHVRKGSDVLLRAFSSVRKAVPAAELHFVGGTPRGVLGPGVVAHGFFPPGNPTATAAMRRLYHRASVFCLPSRYEPFGVAFVEAMLAGLPCVGTAAWAMPEIIEHGRTGWLVPDGDSDALAACLVNVLRDPQCAARMGNAGRERALKTFTWDRVAARAIADLKPHIRR